MNELLSDLGDTLNRVEVHIPHNDRDPLPDWDGGTIRVYRVDDDPASDGRE
ncbi:MAG: hypothetical protein PHH09_09115 [Methanoregulaceae archaeon]|nr:hypothetical protein [Methanoregulaceae archaeon]